MATVPATSIDESEIARRFAFHQPESWQIQVMNELRAKCHELASLVAARVPPGREQALAITHIESAMMIANAGVSRYKTPPNQFANTANTTGGV